MAFHLKNNSISNTDVIIQPKRQKAYNNEILLNNFVEKDIQAILRPLNVITIMFLTAKYQIRDNFITPNTFMYHSCTFLATVLCVSVFFLRAYFIVYDEKQAFDVVRYWYNVTDFIMYFFGYMWNISTNISSTHINVDLVLRLQCAYKLLNISQNEIKNITFFNWACTTCLLTSYIIKAILCWNYNLMASIYDLIIVLIVICFDYCILYLSRLLHLVQTSTKVLIEKIRFSENSEEMLVESYYSTMFEAYDEILKVYDIIEESFKGQVRFVRYKELVDIRKLKLHTNRLSRLFTLR